MFRELELASWILMLIYINRFIPAFTPAEAGRHEVTVKFNSYEVPGSPFYCNVVDVARLTLLTKRENGCYLFAAHRTASLELSATEANHADINMKLTAPSRLHLPLTRAITAQNTLKLSFKPAEIGTHALEIDYAGVAIAGSPFEVKVYDSSRINVSEVKGWEVNKECSLTIDASNAGEGQLEIAVNDGQIKNHVRQLKVGQYVVSFVPTKQDNYVIDIKFNHDPVPGLFSVFFFDSFHRMSIS